MKQFIVDRHTTPATPTLEQVPTEKIPVYESLADVEADLANLADGQIGATSDESLVANLAPVDEVKAGVLKPVTSNAVAGVIAPNYANKVLITDTTSAYNNNYTAPENGYIMGTGWGSGTNNSFIYLTCNGVLVGNQGYSDENISALLPVRKGDVVNINVYLAGANHGVYFVPCN